MRELIVAGLKARQGSTSQNEYSAELGISPAQLSNVYSGKDGTVSDTLWWSLYAKAGPIKLPRIRTQNHTEVQGLLEDARQRHRFVAICADTGLGKTSSIKSYESANTNVIYVLASRSMSEREFAQSISTAMGKGAGCSAHKAIDRAANALRELDHPLLVIDDAGKLGTRAWPLIQELRDRTEDCAGMCVAGMPNLKKFIQQGVNHAWPGFSEIARRIGYWLPLSRPSIEEVEQLCANAGITATKTVRWVHNRVRDFGTLNELLENAILAAVNGHNPNDLAVLAALQVGGLD